MVNAVEKQIGDTSLMNHGTWVYLGSPTDESGRYLFWTSVDANAARAGAKIPVIISRASGGFFVSETATAQRITKKVRNMLRLLIISGMTMDSKNI